MSDKEILAVPEGDARAPEAELASTPEQPDESIATLERAVREKHEAALKAEPAADKNQSPVQPAVNTLKKRKRGKATTFFAIVAVVLIVLAWGGQWVYRNFLAQPPEEKKQEESSQSNSADYRRRTDLGQRAAADDEEQQAQTGDTGSASGQTALLTPDGLNKARFLVRRDNAATPTKAQAKTRQQEMTQAAAGGQQTGSETSEAAQAQNSSLSSPQRQSAPVRRIPYNPDLYVAENTAIPCSLDYRFVSDRAGKIRCTITKDIWSASGNTKLIEKGTGATGVYQTGTGEDEGMRHGQGRAFVVITKLRTRQAPFLDIPLIDTSAAGELGEAGVDGWIDTHFVQRFGGALMVGMIPDIAAWASDSAGKKDRNTDYTENSRQAMAEMAKTTLENSINIPPTLYKNQGEIITLVTGQDIDFSNIYELRMKQ